MLIFNDDCEAIWLVEGKVVGAWLEVLDVRTPKELDATADKVVL